MNTLITEEQMDPEGFGQTEGIEDLMGLVCRMSYECLSWFRDQLVARQLPGYSNYSSNTDHQYFVQGYLNIKRDHLPLPP